MTSEYVKKHYQKVVRLRPEIKPDGTLNYEPALDSWMSRWKNFGVYAEKKIDGNCTFFFYDSVAGMSLKTKRDVVHTAEHLPVLFEELGAAMRAKAAITHCELVKKTETLYVHDVLYAFPNFVTGLNLHSRKLVLRDILEPSEHVQLLEPVKVVSPSEVITLKDELVSQGLEGVMLKANVPYGTTGAWTKLKKWESISSFYQFYHLIGQPREMQALLPNSQGKDACTSEGILPSAPRRNSETTS
jgi:hypothetical protein